MSIVLKCGIYLILDQLHVAIGIGSCLLSNIGLAKFSS